MERGKDYGIFDSSEDSSDDIYPVIMRRRPVQYAQKKRSLFVQFSDSDSDSSSLSDDYHSAKHKPAKSSSKHTKDDIRRKNSNDKNMVSDSSDSEDSDSDIGKVVYVLKPKKETNNSRQNRSPVLSSSQPVLRNKKNKLFLDPSYSEDDESNTESTVSSSDSDDEKQTDSKPEAYRAAPKRVWLDTD